MLKPRTFILFTIFFTTLSVFASTPADLYLKKARDASSAEEKVKNYSVAFKLNPMLDEALLERARIYFDSNDIGKASDDIELYEEKFAPNSEFFLLKGMIAQRNGLLDKADEFFNLSLKMDNKNNEALLRKGILLVTLGQLKNSSANFLEAAQLLSNIKKGKQYVIALSQAAKCFEFSQDYQRTMESYEKLVDTKENNSAYRFNFARLLYMNENYEQSLEELKLATKLSINDRSFKPFYPMLAYYIETKLLKNKVAADYWLQRISDQFPANALFDLFMNKITPEEYMEKIANSPKVISASNRRKTNIIAEARCYTGFYYLFIDDRENALKAFNKVIEKGSFGAFYFYLSRFEAQKIEILQVFSKK